MRLGKVFNQENNKDWEKHDRIERQMSRVNIFLTSQPTYWGTQFAYVQTSKIQGEGLECQRHSISNGGGGYC